MAEADERHPSSSISSPDSKHQSTDEYCPVDPPTPTPASFASTGPSPGLVLEDSGPQPSHLLPSMSMPLEYMNPFSNLAIEDPEPQPSHLLPSMSMPLEYMNPFSNLAIEDPEPQPSQLPPPISIPSSLRRELLDGLELEMPTLQEMLEGSPTYDRYRGVFELQHQVMRGTISVENMNALAMMHHPPTLPTPPSSTSSAAVANSSLSASTPVSATPSASNVSPTSKTKPGSCATSPHGSTQSAQSSIGAHQLAAPVCQSSSPGTPDDDDFVAWDPANPQKTDPREKILRTDAEHEQQRKDAAALKKFGGTCLCCYRAKKKCGTTSPCSPCSSKRTSQRICYRSWGALCLTELYIDGGLEMHSFPAREMQDTLQQMCDDAFREIGAYNAVIEFCERSSGHNIVFHWRLGRSNITFNPPQFKDEHLIDGLIGLLPTMNLIKSEDVYATEPLVWDALRLADLFMAAQALAQGIIRTSWSEIIPGRLVVCYFLIHCFRRLVEVSEESLPDLYEGMCGKDKQGVDSKSNSSPGNKDNMDPTWIAVALYYRIVCALKELQRNPVVAKIFGPSSSSLTAVCDKLDDFLRHVAPWHRASRKCSNLNILNEHIPVFPPGPSVDMTFRLSQDNLHFLSGSTDRQAAYLVPASQVQVFLADDFPRPVHKDRPLGHHNGQSTAVPQVTVAPQAAMSTEDQKALKELEALRELQRLSPVEPCENLSPDALMEYFSD